jgi:hypothetical protein
MEIRRLPGRTRRRPIPTEFLQESGLRLRDHLADRSSWARYQLPDVVVTVSSVALPEHRATKPDGARRPTPCCGPGFGLFTPASPGQLGCRSDAGQQKSHPEPVCDCKK